MDRYMIQFGFLLRKSIVEHASRTIFRDMLSKLAIMVTEGYVCT